MIPILFDNNEASFTNNGLGRLTDCISCVVTEERNGIYECDFEYPVNGAHYDLIKCGRIIGVTHNDSDDIQPFDIVSYTKPINGIVSFHAVHVSYRQSYITVKTTKGINTLADAFTMLATSEPANPFSYWTDKTSTGYLGASDGTPRTVKELLGGVEGSILDIYGGEYEFNKFTVRLHNARGEMRDFTIRYGVNMTDYNDETDISETYNSVIPYWTDGEKFVVGDMVTNGQTVTGRGECVPLDVSDRFESKPSKAQVQSMGTTVLGETRPYLPAQTITVAFARLQDIGYEWMNDLYKCDLCDSINVSFPAYGMTGTYKIVKIEWNVLENKYESMELGALSTTLSEALGITNGLSTTPSSSGGGVKNIWYGTCSTSASTGQKDVTTDTADFALAEGNMVRVRFANANSVSGTTYLSVDNLTNVEVRGRTGASGAQYYWNQGEVVDFVYDGTYFLIVSGAPATTTYYGPTKLSSSTSSTSTELAATPSAVKSAYDLANEAASRRAMTAVVSAVVTLATSGKKMTMASDVDCSDDLSISSGGIKCAKAGYILASAQVYFHGVSNQHICNVAIYKNSTSICASTARASGDRTEVVVAPRLISVAANDVIYVYVSNSSSAAGYAGGTSSSAPDPNKTHLTVQYV